MAVAGGGAGDVGGGVPPFCVLCVLGFGDPTVTATCVWVNPVPLIYSC